MTRVVAQLRLLRWVFLAAAVVMIVVFLVAQRQTIDVSYAQSPSRTGAVTEGTAGESDVDLPSVAELTDMLDEEDLVRLPGSIARWDENLVADAIGDAQIRILVAPPGLTEEQQGQLNDVRNATILILGTSVSGTLYQVRADDHAGWRAQFASGDVTDLLLTMIASEKDEELPTKDVDLLRRRAPTAAELAPVVADLRHGGLHVADGATLESVPGRADSAFPDERPLFAAFPQQPYGEPVPEYGPALAEEFPDTPIVVMYGNWVEYHGPEAEEFAEVVAAGVYSRFGDRLATYAYPQANVLGVYLNQVTDVRYAGLFDRPLPYQPFDPLRVALPVLPWLFVLCVLVFLGLSVRSVVGHHGMSPPRGAPARLAALTTLAIEMSALSRDAALVRGLAKIEAARRAVSDDLPHRHIRRLLDEAESELDTTARTLGRADYRPVNYLAGGIA